MFIVLEVSELVFVIHRKLSQEVLNFDVLTETHAFGVKDELHSALGQKTSQVHKFQLKFLEEFLPHVEQPLGHREGDVFIVEIAGAFGVRLRLDQFDHVLAIQPLEESCHIVKNCQMFLFLVSQLFADQTFLPFFKSFFDPSEWVKFFHVKHHVSGIIDGYLFHFLSTILFLIIQSGTPFLHQSLTIQQKQGYSNSLPSTVFCPTPSKHGFQDNLNSLSSSTWLTDSKTFQNQKIVSGSNVISTAAILRQVKEPLERVEGQLNWIKMIHSNTL